MKIFSVIAAAACLMAAARAEAQKLDLSMVTCKQFIESSKENIPLIIMWLEGYYTDEDDPPVVDFDKMKTDTQALSDYCAKNPTVDLITAGEEVVEK